MASVGRNRYGVRNQDSRLVQDDGNTGGHPVPPHIEHISQDCVQVAPNPLWTTWNARQAEVGGSRAVSNAEVEWRCCQVGWGQGLGRAGAGATLPACPTPCGNWWEPAWIPGGGTPWRKVQSGIEQNPIALLCQGMSPVAAAQVTLELFHSSFFLSQRISDLSNTSLHLPCAPDVPAPGNLPNPLWNKAAGQQVTQPQPLQRKPNS